jgi:hypothetical protein
MDTEVNQQGREADHSSPTNAEVKKMGIYTSTLPYALAQGQLHLFCPTVIFLPIFSSLSFALKQFM